MGIKISELPTAQPLVGTEPLPLVQSAETRQATVADVAPVRSVAGKTGAVSLSATDVGAAAAVHAHDYAATSHEHATADTTGLQAALDAKLAISAAHFPFYDSAELLDAISLNTNGSFPFFDSTGVADNIPMVT